MMAPLLAVDGAAPLVPHAVITPLAATGGGAAVPSLGPISHPPIAIAPLLLALGTAIATLAARTDRSRAALGVAGAGGYALSVALLARAVLTEGPLVYHVSAWPAPLGITLVADALAVAFLLLTAVVALATTVSASLDPPAGRFYHPLAAFLLAGVTGSFLTGDLFNLFVWFEVLLIASYGLVTLPGDAPAIRAGLRYVVLNLVGSAVMLLAIGGLYATTGTLNMADLARRLADPGAYGIDPTPVLGLSGLLLAVFALKAGLVPFHLWVPATYRAAPPPVAALLAGVTKKVGVYAILRVSVTVLGGAAIVDGPLAGAPFLAAHGAALLVLAEASILLGGVAALGATDLGELLAHSSIGQLGFVVLPIGLAGVVAGTTGGTSVVTTGATVAPSPLVHLGVLAAVLYAIVHGLAKAALFLLDGAIGAWVGTTRLDDLGGLARRSPPTAAAFLLGGFGLVGIPPLTGFFGKLTVFRTALGAPAGVRAPTVAVALAGAVLTIGYVGRAWVAIFWGGDGPAAPSRVPRSATVALAVAGLLLVFGVGIDPLYRLCDAAATAAIDTAGYVETVDPITVGEGTDA